MVIIVGTQDASSNSSRVCLHFSWRKYPREMNASNPFRLLQWLRLTVLFNLGMTTDQGEEKFEFKPFKLRVKKRCCVTSCSCGVFDIYIYIYIYIRTHTHTHTYTYIYIYIYIRTYVHTHTHTHIHTHTYIYIYEKNWLLIRLYENSQMKTLNIFSGHTYTHTHIYVRSYTHV